VEYDPIIPTSQSFRGCPLPRLLYQAFDPWELAAYLPQALSKRVTPGSVKLAASSNLFFWGADFSQYMKGSRFSSDPTSRFIGQASFVSSCTCRCMSVLAPCSLDRTWTRLSRHWDRLFDTRSEIVIPQSKNASSRPSLLP
jgi:hypothetical protein